MSRKLTVLTAAMLASLALAAIPAVASANIELYEGSTKLATGTAITTHTIGPPRFVNGSETEIFACTNAKFDGNVSSNGPWAFAIALTQAKFTGTGSEGRCQGGFNLNAVSLTAPLCWRQNIATGERWLLYAEAACGGTPKQVKLTIVSSTFGTCNYEAEGLFETNLISLEPIKLQTPGYLWFVRTSGSCWGRVGVSLSELEVTNSSGGKLKEVHN